MNKADARHTMITEPLMLFESRAPICAPIIAPLPIQTAIFTIWFKEPSVIWTIRLVNEEIAKTKWEVAVAKCAGNPRKTSAGTWTIPPPIPSIPETKPTQMLMHTPAAILNEKDASWFELSMSFLLTLKSPFWSYGALLSPILLFMIIKDANKSINTPKMILNNDFEI